MDDGILLFHGSREEVVYPEIRITRYTKKNRYRICQDRIDKESIAE